MKRIVLFALLGQLCAAEVVAQTSGRAPQAATAQADPDDARKGRLLAAMARWVQRYGEGTGPVAAVDSSSVLAFQQSIQTDATLRDLTERVRRKLSGQSFALAPIVQVSQAIELVVTDRYQPRAKAKAQLLVLTASLARVLAPAPALVAAPESVASRSVVAAPARPATIAAPAEAAPAPAGEGWLRGGIGFLLGLLAGALGCWFWLGQRLAMDRKRIREAVDREYQSVMAQAEARIAALERDKHKAPGRPPRPEEKAASAKTTMPPVPPPASAEARREFEELIGEPIEAAPPEPERIVELPVAPSRPEPVRFYAPAPDVPYIEHRKLSPDPLSVMPIRLQVADGGAMATYGFSPEADQARIIADGVRNLRAFFDFELPPSEQFSRIDTRRPGRLERVGERWEVREKAQLDIR